MKLRTLYILPWLVISAGIFAACNSDSSTTETITTYTTTSTLVQNFYLMANSDVAENLDSVYFTIDQNKGLIYNADSLPVGTDVTKLCASISFGSTVKTAKLHVKGGKVMTDTTFNYTSTTTDSIDFTGNVTLTTTSADGMFTRDYTVKVNVHMMNPDSLQWNVANRRALPGVTSTPQAQRVVQMGTQYYSLVKQNNVYSIAATDDPSGSWTTSTVTFPFTPRVETFSASSVALFILGDNGTLYTSTDEGASWTSCGVTWQQIVGCYGDKALGIKAAGDGYVHDEYPQPAGFEPATVEDNFPIAESSPLAFANNQWSSQQQAMLVGGVTAKGNVTNAVWGYDGTSWAQINVTSTLPALRGAVLIPYYTYSATSKSYIPTQFATWIVLGGKLASGAMNSTVYTSRDQGLRWVEGDTGLQLPGHFTVTQGAQVFVFETTFESDGTSWQCPFIYYYGGTDASGNVVNYAWQGVLNRMLFKPIF